MEKFYHDYSAIMLDRSHICPENNECRIWHSTVTTAKQQQQQYGQIRYKHPLSSKWKTITAHRFNYMLHHKILDLPSELHCSHLCHNSTCINPSHISLEDSPINSNRRRCCNQGSCIVHSPFADCLLHLKLHPVSEV
jgi:hypothetical protein